MGGDEGERPGTASSKVCCVPRTYDMDGGCERNIACISQR